MADPYALHLPNLRSLYLPDEGHVFVEADLARADAQVIAAEAGASRLREALRNDEDIHSLNAIRLFASRFEEGVLHQVRDLAVRQMHSVGLSYRDCAKRWVHATNFGGKARTVGSAIAVAEKHVEQCQHYWLRVEHPEIGALHDRLEFDLRSRKNPVIRNRFGFRRLYVGGDRSGNLLGQALAWIAQSTVAVVINRAMLSVDCCADLLGRERCGICMVCEEWPITLYMQHHDSLLTQVPTTALTPALIARLRSAMTVTVPYDDPLTIPCTVKWSDRSWGHMEDWEDDAGQTEAAE